MENLNLSEQDLKEATIITEGKPSWTFRGHNLIFDKPAIKGIAETHKKAARILLTGEAHVDYIGVEALDFLVSIDNLPGDIQLEPLFIETKRETIRMRRFDPKFVWKCFDPKIIVKLAEEEIERIRINMDPYALEYFDFYESMIWYMKEKNGDFCVPSLKKTMNIEAHFCATYLTCLLLFGKPGYMDVHVSEYFSDPATLEGLNEIDFRVLNEKEQKEVRKLREEYGRINALTYAELRFAIQLYQE